MRSPGVDCASRRYVTRHESIVERGVDELETSSPLGTSSASQMGNSRSLYNPSKVLIKDRIAGKKESMTISLMYIREE